MADHLAQADEAEFAGYVDSGIWMIEEFLADLQGQKNVTDMYLRDLWRDYFA